MWVGVNFLTGQSIGLVCGPLIWIIDSFVLDLGIFTSSQTGARLQGEDEPGVSCQMVKLVVQNISSERKTKSLL